MKKEDERKLKGKPAPKIKPKEAVLKDKKPKMTAPENVFVFDPAAENDEQSDDLIDIKEQIRRAMRLLEDGKAVAAFKLMKGIVDG